MEWAHTEFQSMYRVEVSKLVGPYWLLFPVNTLGGMGLSRDWYLPRSVLVQANLEGIHAISQLMCGIS